MIRKIPKVALLVETSRGFGRELLRGIARYVQLHGPWSFHITAGDFEKEVPRMKEWGGTGIIARIPNERVARAILEANLPTIAVGLSDDQLRPGSPLVRFSELSSNPEEVARLACEHLMERRFRHYAYVGLDDRAWSKRRERAYFDCLKKAGVTPLVYRQPEQVELRDWGQEQPLLAAWIRDLPKPVGLFACNDDRGREVLEACRFADVRVPEEVAVLGVDDDDVFCGLANPPLSSIALNAKTAGYRAAELLDGLMQGKVRKPRKVEVEALSVVTRRSTEVVAVDDQDVASALQFIHRQQGRDISVESVVQAVAVSRRNLEKRFRECLGRTILEEIQLTRLERAKRLLLETTYPISKIADISGFGSTGYFIQFFQCRVGKTPRKFRIELTN